MGYTHFDKVSGVTGLAVGAKDAETTVADSTGLLYQQGTAIRAAAAAIDRVASGSLKFETSIDPSSLLDGAGETKTFSASGVAFGDMVLVGAPYDLQGLIVTGYVQAANVVAVRFQNESGATVDLGAGTYTVKVIKA